MLATSNFNRTYRDTCKNILSLPNSNWKSIRWLTRLSKDVQICVGMHNKKVRWNWGSRTSHLWQSRQSRSVEAEFQIFGSPGKDEMQNKCGRRTRSFEVLTKRSTESGISDLWQSRQSRSAEAELHIFGSPGRGEIRKWTYPYLEVLVEQVREKNEIFRSPGRAEVRKAELLIFGSKDRAELRKSSFRPLKVLAEQSWDAEVNFISLAAKAGRTCGSRTSHLTKKWQSRSVEWISCHIIESGQMEVREQNFKSLAVLSSWKCGSRTLHLWQVLILLIATANVDE